MVDLQSDSTHPLVSIIIPLYNRVALVGDTLQSVLQQTYASWEAIVVDDGSTDGSYELVEKMANQDARIKLHKRSRLPKGASACRNTGTELARGEYLIFLDSDDLLAPFCLEERVKRFQEFPEKDFIVFPMLLFHKEPHDLNILWNVDSEEDDLLRFLRGDALWQTTCPMYRRASFFKTTGFDETLSFWQDYELHLRILILGLQYKKFMHLTPDCYNRRHSQDTISQDNNVTPQKLQMKEKVYRKIYDELNAIEKERKSAYQEIFAAMHFKISFQWVMHRRDLSQAVRCWSKCYEQQIVGLFTYKAGYYCLQAKYWQKKRAIFYLPLGISYKFLSLLLPEKYRTSKSTLCQVPLSNAR